MKRPWIPLAGALILAGCSTPPPSEVDKMPAPMASTWTAEHEGLGTPEAVPGAAGERLFADGWLADIDDPALTALVEEAIAKNYDLQATAARLQIAEANAAIAGAVQWPQLNAAFGGARQKGNFSSSGLGGTGLGGSSYYANNYQAGLDLSWEIDVWGRVRDGASAALADAQAAAATYQGARLSLAAQTAKAWFNAIEAQLQVELAQETFKSFTDTAEVIQRRYERGVSPALDLRLARAQAASAGANLEYRLQARDIAVRQLEVLLGRYPANELKLAAILPVINKPVPVGLPSELLERRPDLVVAERNLAASGKRVSEARKAMLPAISLTGSYGYSSSQLGELLTGNFSVWSLAGNAVQPIFQGRKISANIERTKAIAVQRLAEYGQTALDAFAEVENALQSEAYLVRRVESLQTAATENTGAENSAWSRYQRGLTDIITVLESQRRAFTSKSDLLATRNQRLQNRINLYLALGGDFDIRPAPEAEVITPLGTQPLPLATGPTVSSHP
ncbi:MAG: efflux transporter outer membrane subunit [Verrucomicrobiota bacterium JB024]|nr:efflux transporter outer membrane subunit [Verrucomicrobiota bacterium JB024]